MRKKQILILITCLTLLAAGMSRTVALQAVIPDKSGDEVFKTPEDAINAFFEGITQNDLQKIFAACAINEMAEDFKFDLYVDRLQAFLPAQSYAPSEYPLYVELNRVQAASRIASQVRLFAFSLLSSEPIDYAAVTMMDGDGARQFAQEVDPSRLAGLEVKKIDLPNKSAMDSARYKENAVKLAATMGADDSTERVVLFSFEQNDYVLGFMLFQYGDNWKISSLSSPIAGTSAMGTATKTTPEDFAAMTE